MIEEVGSFMDLGVIMENSWTKVWLDIRHFAKEAPAARNRNYRDILKFINRNWEQKRIERYKILYVWKVIEGLVPNPG